MKRIILLLILFLALTLIGCQKDDVKQAVTGPTTSGGGIIPTEPTTTDGGIIPEIKYLFSEDEVAYFNTLLAKALAQVKDSSVKEKNIDRNNLTFTILLGTSGFSVKQEVKKINNIYLSYETMSNGAATLSSYPFSALNIKDLFREYLPERESFNVEEKTEFEAYVKNLNNPKLAPPVALDALKFFEIDVMDKSGPAPSSSYVLTIWKEKGKYVALDKTGVISTQDSLTALLANSIVNAKIAEALK